MCLTVRLVCYRRVFDPFKIQLRISQSAGTGPVPVASPDTSPAKKTKAKPAGKAQMSQGQEIRLVVPEIGVVMDSREFEVLTDVISNVGLAQVRKRKEKKILRLLLSFKKRAKKYNGLPSWHR